MAADYSGHTNLELMSYNERFNNWIYKEILSGLKGDILEIGSGLGTCSERIIRDMSDTSHITLTDISASYLEQLKKRFSPNNKVSVSRLDLNCETDFVKIGYERFDSIVALNVLEHVRNDEFTLQQLY